MNPSLVPFGLFLFLAAVLWLMPRFTRPDLYFAVTVPPAFRDSPEGRSILRRYRAELVVVLALLLVALATASMELPPLLPGLVFLQLALSFAVFYRARRRVLPYATVPTTIRKASLRAPERKIPGGWPLALGPFLILGAAAVYLWTHWSDIPDRFVTHWNGAMQPDGWGTRSIEGVFTPLAAMSLLLLVTTIFLYGVIYWVRSINAAGVRGAREWRFRRTTAIYVLAVEYFIALMVSWASLFPLFHSADAGPPFGIAFILVPLTISGGGAIVLMRLGQGGSRGSDGDDETDEAPIGDRTSDEFWKLGIVYFNRDDPALFVEKRFGIGYTLNFGRPLAWLLLALIFVPLVHFVLRRL